MTMRLATALSVLVPIAACLHAVPVRADALPTADEACQVWSAVLDEVVADYDARQPKSVAERRIASSAAFHPRLHEALSIAVDGIYGQDEDVMAMIEDGRWVDACADAILLGDVAGSS